MRRMFTRLLHSPALWYGVLGFVLLSTVSILPEALDRWAPQLHAKLGLTSYATVPNLEWQLLLIILAATGVAIGWHTGRIEFALLAVVCAALGSWLLYWAVDVLVPTLTWLAPPPSTEPQDRSYYINRDLDFLVIGLILVVPLSLVGGALSGLMGWGLYQMNRRMRQSLS